MGLYVEVMCDERREWDDSHPKPPSSLKMRCWSHNGDNPQGHTVAEARSEARKQGWIVRGEYACCPGCKEGLQP